MKRSPLISALVVLVTFLCGIAVGAFFSSPLGVLDFRNKSAATAGLSGSGSAGFSDGDSQGAELRAHVADVEKRLTEMGKNQDAVMLSDHLALYKNYRLAPQSFTDDLHVADAMADYLKMSDAERKNVEEHLAQIHDQLHVLEKQHLKLLKQTDTSMSYEIEPFSEGTTLKDELRQSIEGDLGTERADVFLGSSTWEMNSVFAAFGASKTGLEVTRIDQSGPPQYQITERYANGSSMEQNNGSILPAPFNGLVQLDSNP